MVWSSFATMLETAETMDGIAKNIRVLYFYPTQLKQNPLIDKEDGI